MRFLTTSPKKVTTRAVAAVLIALSLLVSTGCQVKSHLDVHVNNDSSGFLELTVDLDKDAVNVLGDPNKELRVEDMRKGGWDIDLGQIDKATGGRKLRALYEFSSVEEANLALKELGPYSGVVLGEQGGLFRREFNASGGIDLRDNGRSFLTAGGLSQKTIDLLRSDPTNREVYNPETAFPISLSVSLPTGGPLFSHATTKEMSAKYGEENTLMLSTNAFRIPPVAWLVLSITLFALAPLFFYMALRSRRKHRKLETQTHDRQVVIDISSTDKRSIIELDDLVHDGHALDALFPSLSSMEEMLAKHKNTVSSRAGDEESIGIDDHDAAIVHLDSGVLELHRRKTLRK